MTRGGFANALFKQTLSRSKSSFLRKKHLAPFTKAYIPHNNIRTISKGYQQKSVFKNQSTSLSPIKTQTPSSFPRQKKTSTKPTASPSPLQPLSSVINHPTSRLVDAISQDTATSFDPKTSTHGNVARVGLTDGLLMVQKSGGKKPPVYI